MMNYNAIFSKMVEYTARYLKDNKLKCMVLGVSGGIDSTLTAAICYEVATLTDIPLIGVSLPCSSNTEDENISARMTMEAFCDEYWTENLQKEYLLMKATCEQHVTSTPISQGNIKARLRMTYLYNIASVKGGIVMDTDNLTENYLGFFTINGDVFDLNPIGCLWKHEIFDMVKWLHEEKYPEGKKHAALMFVHGLVPTDGNGVMAGGDLAQIAPNSTFEEVDAILDEYVNNGSVTEGKYDATTVDMVLSRHRSSAFKRFAHPIKILKRSDIQEFVSN